MNNKTIGSQKSSTSKLLVQVFTKKRDVKVDITQYTDMGEKKSPVS